MTILNAAPNAAPAPSGTTAAPAAPAQAVKPAAVPVQAHHTPARSSKDKAKSPELNLPGSGKTLTSGRVATEDKTSAVVVPLDEFAKQSGPDAEVKTASGMVSVHAVFQLDAKTRELSVAIVDADGALIRMIPPDSVARMIAAMATYRGR